jgi:hypothetical protein
MNLCFNGKGVLMQLTNRGLARLGKGGDSGRKLKSTAAKPSFLDRSATEYNCLVTTLLPC